MAKLPVPLPLNSTKTCDIQISWTIAILSKANAPLNILDQRLKTPSYPHDKKYKFSKGSKSKVLNIITDTEEIANLLADGYSQSSLPTTSN
jgi:hypothetical protein